MLPTLDCNGGRRAVEDLVMPQHDRQVVTPMIEPMPVLV
jgi:hypothetical protein